MPITEQPDSCEKGDDERPHEHTQMEDRRQRRLAMALFSNNCRPCKHARVKWVEG